MGSASTTREARSLLDRDLVGGREAVSTQQWPERLAPALHEKKCVAKWGLAALGGAQLGLYSTMESWSELEVQVPPELQAAEALEKVGGVKSQPAASFLQGNLR